MSEMRTIKDMPVNDMFVSGHGACAGCGMAVAVKNIMRILGADTTVYVPASCLIVISAMYPTSNFRTPYLFTAFENTGAVTTGIRAAQRRRGLSSTVVGLAGDGGTFDIGLQALSGAAERNEDILYVCLDNEGYMNTGIQRSGATPFGAGRRPLPWAPRLRARGSSKRPISHRRRSRPSVCGRPIHRPLQRLIKKWKGQGKEGVPLPACDDALRSRLALRPLPDR